MCTYVLIFFAKYILLSYFMYCYLDIVLMSIMAEYVHICDINESVHRKVNDKNSNDP
jgi:hypothetical protein